MYKYLLPVLFFSASMAIAQDTYHEEIIQFLGTEYMIENPQYVLNDNEVQNLDDNYLYGSASKNDVEATDQDFTLMSEVMVTQAGQNQWDAGMGWRNRTTIKQGDVVLVSFWARNGTTETEIFAFAEDGNTFEKEYYSVLSLTPDWTRYFIPFKASKDYAIGGAAMGFHIASLVQEFKIAGFTAFNFGDAYDIEDMPSSFGLNYEGSNADAEWRNAAADRIEMLRKSDVVISVVDENGKPISGAEVNIEMQSHQFGFGSAFVTCRFPGNDCFDQTYIDKVTDLDGEGHGFNVGVTENALKWDGWEEEWIGSPDETVSAIEWLAEEGIEMRGHTLIWPGFGNMPDDISENRNNLSYLRSRLEERIEEMVEHPVLSTLIKEWDVLNESTTNRDLENSFRADPNYSTGRELYPEIFQSIRNKDPELKLYVNDYIVLSGGGSGSSTVNRYKSFLDEMNSSDYPIDGIGFQCHIGSVPTSINKIYNTFTEFHDRYNVPIKVTEYDINDAVDEDVQADYMSDFLTIIFSHPAVEAFIMWGFWDGNHWKGNAPMFYENWELKPSGQAFIDKVFKDWWTSETSNSDASGIVSFRPFKGKHLITVSMDGEKVTQEIDLTEDREIVIAMEGTTSTLDVSDKDLYVYPNPTHEGLFYVHLPESETSVDIEIYSVAGRKIRTYASVKNNEGVFLNNLSGMYVVKLIGNEASKDIKLVVH